MKGHGIFLIKGGMFAALLAAVLLVVNEVLVPHYFYDTTYAMTSTYRGFYKMERDSVDVLFLGSSHCVNAFSPQELYDSHGIRSYNLGSEQQNLLVSYYWLKEAFRYQTPRVVVLDVLLCFPYNAEEPLNSAEATVRKAFDVMRWSSVKKEAVEAVCEYDGEQSLSSFFFPNIRFHTRWSGLNESDFTSLEMGRHYEMKGYSLLRNRCNTEGYRPFEAGHEDGKSEMLPLMEEYLERIVELCREEDTELVLVKTPCILGEVQSVQRYNAVKEFAEANQLAYFDFNEKNLYNEIGLCLSEDSNDGGHLNYWGARKVSRKMAEILDDRYDVGDRKDRQWEDSRLFYEAMVQNAELHDTGDIVQYLDLMAERKGDYTVFLAVKDEASNALNLDILDRLQNLGLETDLTGKYRNSYYAVVSDGRAIEEIGTEKLAKTGSFRNGRCSYEIVSAGYECGNMCSIKIYGIEYAKGGRGLNIVVYDNLCKQVVDSVCFDTCDGLTATR